MKKIILSLALIGTMVITPTSACMAKVDNPNESVQFKKTSIEEGTDTSSKSVLVEDTITPKCKCSDEKCKKDKDKDSEKDKKKDNHKDKDNKCKKDNHHMKKEICPREEDKNEDEKIKEN